MTKRKALIVDDEEDTCFLLSVILKQQDCETNCVHSLTKGAEAIAENRPDVIFLDNNLPDGLGVDAIPNILQEHPQIKIVLITAFDTLPTRTKAFNSGAHHFVGKPFDKYDIQAALTDVFNEET